MSCRSQDARSASSSTLGPRAEQRHDQRVRPGQRLEISWRAFCGRRHATASGRPRCRRPGASRPRQGPGNGRVAACRRGGPSAATPASSTGSPSPTGSGWQEAGSRVVFRLEHPLDRDPGAPGEEAHELVPPPGGLRAGLSGPVLLRPSPPSGRCTPRPGTRPPSRWRRHALGPTQRPHEHDLGAARRREGAPAPHRTGHRADSARVRRTDRTDPGVPAPDGRAMPARIARGDLRPIPPETEPCSTKPSRPGRPKRHFSLQRHRLARRRR